ncbi:MAG: recombinase family protein, partial [Nitrospirae bacterium YQR-1]
MSTRKVQTRPHQTSVNPSQAIGYVRVSTIEQATEGISLDNQKAKIRAYCELNGLTLV